MQELIINLNWGFFGAACVFIMADVLTGLWSAVATETFSSTKMREGLKHKITLLMWLVLAGIVDVVCATIGYDALGAGVPVFESVCVYICVMELGSCAENLSKANPEMSLSRFFGGKDDGK